MPTASNKAVKPAKRRARKILQPRSVRGIKPWSSDEVYDRLEQSLGHIDHRPKLDGTSELAWTILSQHTSDLNAGRAYDSLKERFASWQEVVDAPTEELIATIRHGGLAQQKAPRIQEVLRSIKERTGGYDISFLAEGSLDEAKAWLTSLPGVGPKTAGVVLSFALGMPAMAVDTHIHRVSRRLALIGPKVTADEAHAILERSIAPERVFAFHVYLITHGRRVCKAQRPLCNACVLAERCPGRLLYATVDDDRQPVPGLASKPL